MEKAASRVVAYGIFLLLALLATTGQANGNLRLPNGTIPMHYTLRLDTAIERNVFNYTGSVQIKIAVLEPSSQLVLHSTRSTIRKVQLRNDTGIVPIKRFQLDLAREFLVVEVATLLHPSNGMYTLEINFTNSVDRGDLAGFYKVSYRTENDIVRYVGVTDFESIDARSAFPCFDEPGLKATFELHISCGSPYHVRSNTPARSVQLLPDGRKLYHFTKTPRMSTYLVAWFVSDFVAERQVLDRVGLSVATWAKPGTSPHVLSYSVNASVRFLHAMEQYFAEPYRLPKMDNIAIPTGGFSSMAMENWGLVTYREASIYFNPKTDSIGQQRQVVKIVAHEYTHQIFGNLLTPQWWSYLWLKEGFAHFYTYYLASISHPEHNLRKRFITESLQTTFNQDAFATVSQMTDYVEKRRDILSLYTNVAYAKAACVIRMMHYALGEPIFQHAIRHYIQRNKKRGVVTENDLFDSLDLAAKKAAILPKNLTMHEVFRTWSHQAGYPVVTVRRDGSTYIFTQRRFLSNINSSPVNSSAWWIPISFSTANNTAYAKLPAFWMAPHVAKVSYTIPTHSADEVVVFNPHSTGLYRVEYDGTMRRNIIQQLGHDHTAIEPTARARLLDDSLHLAYTRGGNFSEMLQLLDYLRHEKDLMPWTIAEANIHYLQALLRTSGKTSRLLRSYVETIVTPLHFARHNVHDRSSGLSDSFDELQSIVTELACGASESCQKATETIRPPSADALLHLSDSDRPKELHRLIVGSKMSPGVLLETIQTKLSHRQRNSADEISISKILSAISRYAMEPAEEKLLTSVATAYATRIVPEIEQQLRSNRRWMERNVQPLTEALASFLKKRA